MSIKLKVGGSWKDVGSAYIKVSGSWKSLYSAYIKVSEVWKLLFTSILTPSIQSQVTIAKSTNGTTFLVTLTGTNFYWSESPTSLTYKFQWSSDGGSSWSDISTGTATNPSSGSSNTYTYSVPTSEVSANVNNLYQFLVTATNSAGGATSTSSTTSIQGPTNISDLSVTSTGSTSVSLSWTASTGASAYLLYYATTPPSYTLGQTVVGSTSGTVSGLSNSTLYYFKVMPITGTSNTYKGYSGNFSNIVTTTTTGPPVNTVAPSISPTSGTAGSTSYSVTNGTWTGSPTSYTYQWKSYDSPSYVNAPGSSTSSSYTPPSNFFTLGYFSPIKCVVTAINSAGSTSVDSSNTASVSLPNYTVTWNAQGGSVSPSSSSGSVGTIITAPTPTYTGNTFLYWRDGTTVFNYANQVSAGGSWTIAGNTTFYAWWTPIQYTVTYNANGGSVSPASATVNYGSSVTLPTPTRSGYTFNGWYTASSGGTLVGSAGASYTPSATITIYAQWTLTPVIPTITIAANSGITSTAGTINWTSTNQASFSVDGTFSATGTTGTSVSKTGLSPSTTYTGVITVTSSTGNTATANYSLSTSAQPTYTVTFNGNGGTTPGAQVVNQGSAITLPSSTRTGYTFNGWYDTPSGSYTYGGPTNGAAGASFTPPSTITMYARWINNSSAGSVTLTTTDTAGAGGRFNFSNATATGVTGTLTYYWTLGTAANHTQYNALTANTTGSQTTTRTTAIVFDVYSSFTGQDGGTYTSATATVSVTFT